MGVARRAWLAHGKWEAWEWRGVLGWRTASGRARKGGEGVERRGEGLAQDPHQEQAGVRAHVPDVAGGAESARRPRQRAHFWLDGEERAD
eukprot:364907-Chlamydomonas_euryale.AAC.5